MSLFSELKRRNVFRVAVAYVVASWLVLQVVDVVQPILKFPDWVAQLTLLLLVLGFIAALIISWAYEITPEGIKRESEVAPDESVANHTARRLDKITIALVVVAIAAVVVDRLVPEQTPEPSSRTTQDPSSRASEQEELTSSRTVERSETDPGPISDAPVSDTPSVAVLPFTNMSADPENEYFADGISEELLNMLVKVDGLRVPSRTSSFAFKGQNRDIREIASELEVGHILEGSVRKADNRVRITAQLIDVSTDTHLWSETYDRELEDIFAIQDEIAGHIVEAMHLVLGTGIANRKPTENLDAYTLYLQARELFRMRADPTILEQSSLLLRQAVAMDPDFAEAWGLLAMVEITIPSYEKTDYDQYLDAALEAANTALALESTQLDARLALTQVANINRETEQALEQFRTIIEQSPNSSQARLWYAITLLKTGYLAQAFEQVSVAVELDPVHATALDWYARIALCLGLDDQVMGAAQRSIQLGRPQGMVAIINYYMAYGNLEDVDQMLGDDDSPWAGFRKVFHVRDNPDELAETLDWFEQNQHGPAAPYMALQAYLIVGDEEGFYTQLDFILSFDDTVDFLLWLPTAEPMRSADTFNTWAVKRGYDALWRSNGAPEFCQPIDAGGWECE